MEETLIWESRENRIACEKLVHGGLYLVRGYKIVAGDKKRLTHLTIYFKGNFENTDDMFIESFARIKDY